ncbi:MAG: ABC transporter permease [Synergistetes bacterium]|nr:ABC transporter permease [Synergistota bacterium]
MGRFILRRLFLLIPVLIGVSIIAFLILHLAPGDPAELLAGEEATQEDIMHIRQQFGLDKPLYVQYFRFIKGIFTGELISLKFEMPVMQVMWPRIINTIKLSLASILIAVLIGIPAGVLSATHRYSWIDYISMVAALMGVSMPVFWWGLILILLFAVTLGVLPSGGIGGIRHIILPAVVLGTASTAIIARMTRSSMLDVLRQDYITTARAKGLPERIVIYRHALRNALIPTVTVVGLQFGYMLAGAVLTETVFSWPGVGRLLVDSILARDFPVVQASLLIIAMIFVLVNLAVDILYAFLDPRIRYE